MSTDLAPEIRKRYFDSTGIPLAGGKLYTYAAGTTTPLATYTDSTGSTPNTNPVILDSQGYADVWLGSSVYKFQLQDSLGNVLWTTDNIQSLNYEINNNLPVTSVVMGALFKRIVGTSAQVASTIATDTTIASAMINASAGDTIYLLAGTYAESPTLTKKLTILGTGENTVINGSITFDVGSDYSLMRNIRTTQNITLNAGVSGCMCIDVFLASGKTFVDNSTGSYVSGIQET